MAGRWIFLVLGAGLVAGCAIGESDEASTRVRGPDAGAPVLAPLGDIDPTFGKGGIAAVPVADFEARALAVQPDGKIVVAGSRFDDPASSFEGYVVRFLADGTLDPSFDGDGVRLLDAHGLGAWALALGPSGEIVLGGAGSRAAQLWRLKTDGSPDPTFDGDGVLALADDSAWIDAVAVTADGDILAKGEAAEAGLYVARVRRDGTLDPAYRGGVVPSGAFIEHDTVALPDGSWVVVGNLDDEIHPRTTNFARIGPDGAPAQTLAFTAIDAEYVDRVALVRERLLLGVGRTPGAWIEARGLDGALDGGFKGDLGRERGVVAILPHADGAFEVLAGDDHELRLHHRRSDGSVGSAPWQSALPAATWLSHVEATVDPSSGDVIVAAMQHAKVGDRWVVTGSGLSRLPRSPRRR